MKRQVDCSVSPAVARAIAMICVLAACAPHPAHPIPIAVLAEPAAPLPQVDGLLPHALVVPPGEPPPADHTSGPLARARTAYAAGDFDACRGELARIDVPASLAAGLRDAAARALAFDAACAWGGQAQAQARTLARRLAGFGLALPDAPIAPDIEAVIGEAIVAAGNAKTQPVAVRGTPGARLAVDGRPPGCALPCTVDLIAGDHVLAVTADGFTPAHQVVRVPDSRDVALPQLPAAPALAQAQWRARGGATDAIGARLIAELSGEPRVAVLRGASGALIVDGALAATASDRDPQRLLRELAYGAGVLRRPSVWQRPWFWIAVSGVALGVAAGITALTYQPTRHTDLQL